MSGAVHRKKRLKTTRKRSEASTIDADLSFPQESRKRNDTDSYHHQLSLLHQN